jgi:hypothetical protein
MTTETRDVVVVGAASADRSAAVPVSDERLGVAPTGDRAADATGGKRESRTRPRAGGGTDADRTRGTTADATAVTDRPVLARARTGVSPRSNDSIDDTRTGDHV